MSLDSDWVFVAFTSVHSIGVVDTSGKGMSFSRVVAGSFLSSNSRENGLKAIFTCTCEKWVRPLKKVLPYMETLTVTLIIS